MVDALKGISAQLIVLHHLASYGPLAKAFERLAPALSAWLFGYGRMVVQVFLVVAGYLAARSLAPSGRPDVTGPLRTVLRRYARLMPPFVVAMLFAVLAAALARSLIDDEAIPDTPTLWQFIAHGLLVHGIAGVPPLSAGVWYVAIDLQLFAMMVLLLWGGGHPHADEAVSWLFVAAIGALSLFVFNRDPAFDNWAIYFFGSYALGAGVWYGGRQRAPVRWLIAIAAVAVLALLVEFRLRLAIALVTALLLFLAESGTLPRIVGACRHEMLTRVAGLLGRVSYSVFLVHFSVCLIANALYARFSSQSDLAALGAMLAAVAASMVAGAAFHRHVECRRHWLPALVRDFAPLLGRVTSRRAGFPKMPVPA